jgi:hypothetical protein
MDHLGILFENLGWGENKAGNKLCKCGRCTVDEGLRDEG